jgi:hypothetical protein
MSSLPTDHESLQVLLAKVHERLSQSGYLDADSQAQLRQIESDIERALQQQNVASKAPIVAPAPVATEAASAAEDHGSRLEELAVRFEADHPSLAASLRQLTDLLGKAGI